MKTSLITLLVMTAAAGPIANQADYQIFEKISVASSPWALKKDSQVNADQSFKLRIHLKNQNIPSFHQKVFDISTPSHPSYGQHLSRLEVNQMLAPAKESYELVLQWLDSQGLVNKAIVENDWIILDGTIGDVEHLLQTEYQRFANEETGKVITRTLAYSLPASLHAHIDIIAPTIKFSNPSPHVSTILKGFAIPEVKSSASSASDIHDGLDVVACNSSITPDCLKALYKLNDFQGSGNNSNQIALAGFLEEHAQHDDLAQFLSTYDTKAVGSDFSTILINGGLNTQQNVGGPQNISEANLDIQYGLSLAYPTSSIYISTGGRPPETTPEEVDNEPYLEFLTYLLSLDKIPQTISISYGDVEWTVPESYANTVCSLFAQIGARGVSVMVSSGDSGTGSDCTITDPSKLLYIPAFPASCPFVTAVGATYKVEPEVVVSFSGGGFSNYFPRPAYQDATISKYLNQSADPNFFQYYNRSGRAYPDVSAQGVNFHTILGGDDSFLSGTSASSPTFAGVVALLNGDRISNGLAPFGFLNPWLYSKATGALTDIVGGKQAGCSQVPGSGFPAVSGWDPATGLGTPDFKKLRVVSTGTLSKD